MARSLFVRPADDLIRTATLVATAEDSAYPVENLQDGDPASVFKAGATATTVTATHTSAVRRLAGMINTSNLAGATVTVGGVTFTVPARTADGQCVNGFLALSLGAATSTAFAISGASVNVQIGELVLASAVTELEWMYGVEFVARRRSSRQRTFLGSDLVYDTGIRQRRASGRVLRDGARAAITALWESAKGDVLPFLLVPDQSVNDAWYVRFVSGDQRYARVGPNATEMPIDVEEVSMGLVL